MQLIDIHPWYRDRYQPRLLIVGYRKFSELINTIVHHLDGRARVDIVESVASKDVDYESLLEKYKPDVVISAGSNATYLARTLSIPVVGQPVTDTDIIESLGKARLIGEDIHLFLHKEKDQPESRVIAAFNKLIDASITLHLYSTADEAREMVTLVIAEHQPEVVVGPSLICHIAQQNSIPSILIYSKESALELLENAVDVAQQSIHRDVQASVHSALMDDPYEPLLVVDPDGKVLSSNAIAEENFRLSSINQESVRDILHLDLSNQGIQEMDQLLIGGKLWHCKRYVLARHDETFGFIFRFIPHATSINSKPKPAAGLPRTEFVYRSAAMKVLDQQVAVYGASHGAILIEGESGTGKEIIAKSIYAASRYSEGPLVTVNGGSIPNDLFESEMFGYVDGAFTSARRGGHRGLFVQANNGVLFLDEISEMPLLQQAKLLRVLQENRVRPVGSDVETEVNIKVIAATNRCLAECVAEGSFRRDLYYRLNVFTIKVPSLRERIEDIPVLFNYFLERFQQVYDIILPITPIWGALQEQLVSYAWPGNVRQLENFAERIAAVWPLCDGLDDLNSRLPVMIPELYQSNSDLGAHNPRESLSLKDQEMSAILEAMQRFNNDKQKVAEFLGISTTTLWRRLKAAAADANSGRKQHGH